MDLAYMVMNPDMLLVNPRTTIQEAADSLINHDQVAFRDWAKRAAFALERGCIGRVAILEPVSAWAKLRFYAEFDNDIDAIHFALAFGAKPLARALNFK